MKNEKYTEDITLREMQIHIGKSNFGYVFPQGNVENFIGIIDCLKTAGGKPKSCDLQDYANGGKGKAQPEYIITFDKKPDTIIVVECKKNIKEHISEALSQPKKYAVDGVLYYAKFLKDRYNVIAVASSGTTKEKFKTNTYYWQKGQSNYLELENLKNIIVEPQIYLNVIEGKKVEKAYSLEDIKIVALNMNNALRELGFTQKYKPIFIAGILIALENEAFESEYKNLSSFDSIINQLKWAINEVLSSSGIKKEYVTIIKNAFDGIGNNVELKRLPLGQDNSITWFIDELSTKIKPMMNYSNNTIDALGIFYQEFVKYSSNDGKDLGMVLTPWHLTDFMCDIAGVNKNSRIVDICCGSGAFLVTAMGKMFKEANDKEKDRIRKEQLYGVEKNDDLYILSVANMIIRGDGKSNISRDTCFSKEIINEIKSKNIDIGLINPPYSQKGEPELKFVKTLLDCLTNSAIGVVVVPMSCAIGTKFKSERELLFENHTLKAVFSMPSDIFDKAGTNVCVMVWQAHKPHDANQTQTFFGYYKDDGFVKAKKLGRIDKFNKWNKIKKEWVRLYRELEIKEGLTAKQVVTWKDEWLVEAYMETDYFNLKQEDFQATIEDRISYLIKGHLTDLSKKFTISDKEFLSDVKNWGKFRISDLFDFTRGKRITKEFAEQNKGNVPVIAGGAENDGILCYLKETLKNRYVFKDTCFTVSSFGSAGSVIYHNYKCFIDDKALSFVPRLNLSVYTCLFLETLLNLEKYRYVYGRGVVESRYKDIIIKLPTDKRGNPDWQYMGDYVKSLPYSDKI
ncbi:MAG: N-6 DNA methylase [Endomicrobium sp.]|jgi:type I restriction-modification system DNA methylase subunit|nr:N-6 DNA methylase [Endomicrobium sp.]